MTVCSDYQLPSVTCLTLSKNCLAIFQKIFDFSHQRLKISSHLVQKSYPPGATQLNLFGRIEPLLGGSGGIKSIIKVIDPKITIIIWLQEYHIKDMNLLNQHIKQQI